MSPCANSTLVCPAARTRRCASATEAAETSIETKCACGLRAASVTVCAPTPQPASSTRAPGRVGRVAVQQFHERSGLIVQPFALALVVAVDVGVAHGSVVPECDTKCDMDLVAIGAVQSPLKDLDSAPLQGDEGAPEAWLVFDDRVADGCTASPRVTSCSC